MKYRSEIDGLRTVAVLPVILFHMGYGFVKGGFFGVDVFFVISGFLITKILTHDIENGDFSVVKFWIRRIKRLLPLLITVILATLIVAPLLVFKPVVKEISKDIFPAIFSYFNFHALVDFGDYWGGKAEESFFLHTWSLSVEEQYYLFYSFFLFLVFKVFKNFVYPILTIAILSLGWFVYQAGIASEFDRAFYLLPSRIWELALGGLAGIISFQGLKAHKFARTFPWIGLALIVFALFRGTNAFWFFLLPVFGSILIIIFSSPEERVGKFLSHPWMVFCGKISYSLYLWHWVVIVLFKNLPYQLRGVNHHVVNAFILLIVFTLSVISYFFIENKTRKYQHTPKLVLFGILLISGITFYYQSNSFQPIYPSAFQSQVNYTKYYDITPDLTESNKNLKKNSLGYSVTFPDRLPQFSNSYRENGIVCHPENGKPKLMLLGDSHGVMWGKLLDEISGEKKMSLSCFTSNGSNPFFEINHLDQQKTNKYYSKEQRIEYANAVLKSINDWNPKVLVMACRWSNDYFPSHEFLNYLEKRNVKVLVFTQPPILNFMVNKNAAQYLTYLGVVPNSEFQSIPLKNKLVEKFNQEIKNLVKQHSNVVIYDVYQNMLDGSKTKVSLKNDVLYFDDDHLSYAGTRIHKNNIAEVLEQMIGK